MKVGKSLPTIFVDCEFFSVLYYDFQFLATNPNSIAYNGL